MQLTRRQIVRTSAAGLALTALAPLVRPAAAWSRARRSSASAKERRVLVVLELNGANDGLNTVVPLGQDEYFRLRPTLAVARKAALPLSDTAGLHPALAPLAALHAEGRLAIQQRVGLPEPNRSHFRALEIWHTADPDHAPGRVGWLGRLADQIVEQDASSMPLVHVGGEGLPLSAWAERQLAPSFRGPEALRLAEVHAGFDAAREALLDGRAEPQADLAFLRDAARGAYAAARRLADLAQRPTRAEYPRGELARRLALIASLISGGFETRVYALSLGGFDTHARQAAVHVPLLTELGLALAAFQRDLEAQGAAQRVLTFVYSEFGRRAEENASQGTDHGAAAPVFLLGPGVRSGVHGADPDLGRLVDGDVPAETDFRAVYAALERSWMGLEPSSRLAPVAIC